ncbi:MAG: type II methionyl aminopeptidase [Nanoarchaeota archaeon]
MDKKKILKAGKIAKQVREYITPLIKKNVSLLEIANKIEDKIIELGGKPAFPTNLSINNITAHSTPTHNDETKAHGLLKVDFGVHINGWTSDTAFSIDLENNKENKKLIEASEKALENAIKITKENILANEIGKTISETIESYNFSPVRNLAGHQMENYELHAGITIPNIDDKKNITVSLGLYAIEPFATNGSGKVHDGKPSEIYIVIDSKNPRSPIAREILNFILEEYQTLPFCSRWLVKKFGTKALIGLSQLTQNKNLHRFAQLVETPNSKVAQSEHTILIEKNEIIVTTR